MQPLGFEDRVWRNPALGIAFNTSSYQDIQCLARESSLLQNPLQHAEKERRQESKVQMHFYVSLR